MSGFEQRYIVQDLETGEFLCPDPLGGVTTTMYIKYAGQFDNYDEALELAKDEIDGAFSIFGFWLSVATQ